MKKYLSQEQMAILTQAVIILKLDYCNSVYYGCQKSVINQLQTVQNRACRVIFGLIRKSPIESKLKELHWLKIMERIEYKYTLLVYKTVNGLSPSYLKDLIFFNNVTGSRSISLHIPDPHSKNIRAFQIAAPSIWNNLPSPIKESENIKSFKKNLKTFLFKKSYDQ